MALPKQGIGTLRGFFRATIVGGLLFLLPMVLILIVLRHAMQLAVKFTKPISDLLPVEAVLGVRREIFIAVLLLIFISFVAGLIANTNAGRRVIRWFENSFLGGLPQYQLMKSMAEGLARVESAESVQPALVSIEDGWQIAYLLEPLKIRVRGANRNPRRSWPCLPRSGYSWPSADARKRRRRRAEDGEAQLDCGA
jgi:uncharacterized membrane protein